MKGPQKRESRDAQQPLTDDRSLISHDGDRTRSKSEEITQSVQRHGDRWTFVFRPMLHRGLGKETTAGWSSTPWTLAPKAMEKTGPRIGPPIPGWAWRPQTPRAPARAHTAQSAATTTLISYGHKRCVGTQTSHGSFRYPPGIPRSCRRPCRNSRPTEIPQWRDLCGRGHCRI